MANTGGEEFSPYLVKTIVPMLLIGVGGSAVSTNGFGSYSLRIESHTEQIGMGSGTVKI